MRKKYRAGNGIKIRHRRNPGTGRRSPEIHLGTSIEVNSRRHFKFSAAAGSRLQQEVAAKIVRFHVRANSDCASDQQIKLQVRDAVAEELQTILHGAETKAETEEILRENEPSIRAAALQTLRAGGSTDDITVTYGKASFEEKETGNYILPAGTYDALQINIGRAKGHNWWCMLYPSICFSDALRPVNEDGESAEKVEKSRIPLQNLLSDAAYREILKSDRISFRFFWR